MSSITFLFFQRSCQRKPSTYQCPTTSLCRWRRSKSSAHSTTTTSTDICLTAERSTRCQESGFVISLPRFSRISSRTGWSSRLRIETRRSLWRRIWISSWMQILLQLSTLRPLCHVSTHIFQILISIFINSLQGSGCLHAQGGVQTKKDQERDWRWEGNGGS